MKVLVFTTQINSKAGFEKLAIELAVELNRQGIEADLLSQYSKGLSDVNEDDSFIYENGVNSVHYLDLNLAPGLPDVFLSIFRLRKLVKEGGYDAIEVSGFGPSLISSIALIRTKTVVLIGLHYIFNKDLHNTKNNKLLKFVLNIINKVRFYAISNAVAQSWSTFLGINQNHIPVVMNSINNNYFNDTLSLKLKSTIRNDLNIPESAHCILFIGRLIKSKGLDTLYYGLKNYLIEKKLYLIIVGKLDTGEDAYDELLLSDIKTELQSSEWAEHVHFIGLRSDIPEIMADCDVLVHPARMEGFGLVLAEALAMGLPVIATKVGGIPEVLIGTDSIMIPVGNQQELIKSVLNVLNWPLNKKDTAITHGKQRAQNFKVENRAKSIIKLLKS